MGISRRFFLSIIVLLGSFSDVIIITSNPRVATTRSVGYYSSLAIRKDDTALRGHKIATVVMGFVVDRGAGTSAWLVRVVAGVLFRTYTAGAGAGA